MGAVGVRPYGEVVREFLVDSDTDEWRVTTADFAFLATLAERLHADGTATEVALLCSSAALTRLDGTFRVASRARDLLVDDVVALRELAVDGPVHTVLVGPTEALTLVPLGGGEAAAVRITDGDVRDRLRDRHDAQWDAAMPRSIDEPPYSRVVESAEGVLDADVRTAFEAALDAGETREARERLGSVALMLLVAAAHEREFRAVVDWAERTTLASQGTVSRTKGRLEEAGLLATEPVKEGVGRPRQRLVLAEASLRSVPVADLVNAAGAVVGGAG